MRKPILAVVTGATSLVLASSVAVATPAETSTTALPAEDATKSLSYEAPGIADQIAELGLDDNTSESGYPFAAEGGEAFGRSTVAGWTNRRYTSWITGKRLDSNHQGKVYPHKPNNSYFQWWSLTGPNSNLLFKNRATQRCLDAWPSGKVTTEKCAGWSKWQRWVAIPTKGPKGRTSFKFKNRASGKCLISGDWSIYQGSCNHHLSRDVWYR